MIFTRYFHPTGLVDDKEVEDNENSTDDEVEFSVIVVGNITWI